MKRHKTLETEETIVIDSPESLQKILKTLIDKKQDTSSDK